MGIQGLSKVIADHAPRAIQEHPITNYFGRKVLCILHYISFYATTSTPARWQSMHRRVSTSF